MPQIKKIRQLIVYLLVRKYRGHTLTEGKGSIGEQL